MLRKITIRNFEGIETAELELGPITMLYGANGAGKSSLRDAIEHALTGEPCRGGVLADVIRQGAKAAEVEVVVENGNDSGLSIIRRRTKSSGKQMIQGVECPAGEAQSAIEQTIGAPTRAILAALRAGALLDLKPEDLQALLASLTGATFDEAAIAAALPDGTSEAAKRAGLGLPKTFASIPDVAKAAEGARVLAKRQLAEREADLERTPQGHPGDEAALRGQIKALRARREKAAAAAAKDDGAREEKLRALREKMEKARAVPPAEAPVSNVEEALSRARTEAVSLAGELRAEEARLAEVAETLQVGDADEDAALVARAEEIEKALDEAATKRAEAEKREADLLAKGKARKAQLERLPVSGCVGPCPVLPDTDCPVKCDGLKERLEKDRDALLDSWKAAHGAVADAKTAEAAAVLEASRLADARARVDARASFAALDARVTKLREQHAAAEKAAEQLAPKVAEFRAASEAAEKYSEAQETISKLTAALSALENQPTPDAGEPVAELDAQIAAAEASLEGIAQSAARQIVEAAHAKAKQTVKDCDDVAQACKSARVKLLAAAVGPFVTAANAALAKLASGYAVEIGESLELSVRKGDVTLRPAQLSDGERTRLLFVLQYAVCKLAGVKFLPLDRAELLDDSGKAGLKKLITACAADGVQVLMLSCAAPPDAAPKGVGVWVVDGGRVRAIGR